MKKNQILLLFFMGFNLSIFAQVAIKLKYEIKNETKDPIYYAIGYKKNHSLSNKLSPLNGKKSVSGVVLIKNKDEFPILLITDSLKNDMADKIYFYPLQDLKTLGIKNKSILIKVKDDPLRENITLRYEFGDLNKNFTKKRLYY